MTWQCFQSTSWLLKWGFRVVEFIKHLIQKDYQRKTFSCFWDKFFRSHFQKEKFIYVRWVFAYHLIKKVHKSSAFSLLQTDSMYTHTHKRNPFQMCLIMSFEAHTSQHVTLLVCPEHIHSHRRIHAQFFCTFNRFRRAYITETKRQDKQRKSICGFSSHRAGKFLRSFRKKNQERFSIPTWRLAYVEPYIRVKFINSHKKFHILMLEHTTLLSRALI